jgi:hypothetical protein
MSEFPSLVDSMGMGMPTLQPIVGTEKTRDYEWPMVFGRPNVDKEVKYEDANDACRHGQAVREKIFLQSAAVR